MAHQYAGLRQQLVNELRRRGVIRSGLVADAFTTVPRHLFAPAVPPEEAYANKVIPLKEEEGVLTSSLSQPEMMAIMLEALDLQPGMSVLEIGTGSGYNAALIRQIVGSQGRVVSLDIESDLIEAATAHLAAAGNEDVTVITGDGAVGYPRFSPYDRIIATAAVPDITAHWWSQLAPGGRIAIPLVLIGNKQLFVTFERHGGELISTRVSPTAFIRLRGEYQGSGFKRSPVGPHQGVFVRYNKEPAITPELLYEQLTGQVRNHPLQVKVNRAELQFGLLPWLYLHEPALLHLVARQPAGPFVPPVLHERDPHLKGTLLLAGANGSATLANRSGVGDRLRKSIGNDESHNMTLQIRQFGGDIGKARRLAGLVNAWAQQGKPGVEKMRIRAVPSGSGIKAPAGALTLEKSASHFFIFWA